MAFNIGDLGNLSAFNIPEMETPKLDLPGEPPRKIDLTEDEEKLVVLAQDILSDTGITIETLFELFSDWQSSKMKSLKRFVLSFSFILSLTIVAGVNITDMDLFGISVHEDMSTVFLGSLALVLILAFAYYEYLRRMDSKIHQAKISSVSYFLDKCTEVVQSVDEIVTRNNIKSVRELFDDFKGSYDLHDRDLNAYNAIKFYQDNLKKPRKSFGLIEKMELAGIYGLGLLGLAAIIYSFFGKTALILFFTKIIIAF